MSSRFTVVEDFQKSDKSGTNRFVSHPNYNQSVAPQMAEFIFRASQVLTEFKKKWQEEHTDDWTSDLEMDNIPVLTQGMITGFMVISEVDGVSYDYAPQEMVDEVPKP